MNAMFVDSTARIENDMEITKLITDRLQRIHDGKASVTIEQDPFNQNLASYDFLTPRDLISVSEFVADATAFGTVPMTNPRYFGLFNPAPTYAAECADRIVAAFNPQLAVWTHAPAAVDIERHTVTAISTRLGFPEGAGGHFTVGGSEANETAVLCALTRANRQFSAQGARAYTGQPTLYVSRESHLAWFKIAHKIGIGRDAVRLIETDGTGRMSVAALREAIAADRKNAVIPIFVASTAGTTNAGMIDPIEQIDALAKNEGIWHHVDAAWGGALIASARLKPALSGIELADSVTVDAHKWFATTMGAGIFICKSPDILSEVFRVSADYMPSNDSTRDPYVTSALWSRRFVGVRLFMSLAVSGWNGYAAHVEKSVDLIDRLRRKLEERGWQALNSSPVAVLNIVPPTRAGTSANIVSRVQMSGEAWISLATFERQECIRICTTNGQTTLTDVEALVELLCEPPLA